MLVSISCANCRLLLLLVNLIAHMKAPFAGSREVFSGSPKDLCGGRWSPTVACNICFRDRRLRDPPYTVRAKATVFFKMSLPLFVANGAIKVDKTLIAPRLIEL